jgi:DNA-binding IclR family transcriptional regulator
MDIIDFMACFPGRSFSLAEIGRATGINGASCHAILNALVDRGYLSRSAGEKSFVLGPALAAAGEAAVRSQPLLHHARDAATRLSGDLDLPVLLSAGVGDEIVGVLAIPDTRGRMPDLQPGARLPMVPPVGASFLAWEDDAVIDEWLARSSAEDKLLAGMRGVAERIRERGFQVTLRNPRAPRLAHEIGVMAGGKKAESFKTQLVGLVGSLEQAIAMPEAIAPEKEYDVILIAAPIFDRTGKCVFNLCLGDFQEPLMGSRVLELADRLLAECLRIMRADRNFKGV